MADTSFLAVFLAGLVAGILAWWSYARMEERVDGRSGPAVLRGVALFLLLAGWFLPTLRGGPGTGRGDVALLIDASLSMSLPASVGGVSRADSAEILVRGEDADYVFSFGDSVRSGAAAATADGATRLVDGLVAARAAGADRVIVVTDGELDDRERARRTAARLGLAVDERRVAAATGRLSMRRVSAPRAVEAGDTIPFVVEVTATGPPIGVDSSSVSVTDADGLRSVVRFAVPTPGRAARVTVPVPSGGRGEDRWRPFDVRLGAEADPLTDPIPYRSWVEIRPSAAGAVMISVDPDWEPHYLLPVLERATAGGARAWLRVGEGRWIRSGTERMQTGDDARVRQAARAAQLLVVQGDPGELPAWLSAEVARHPRLLMLARGSGDVPGSALRVGEPLPGDWYPGGTPPPSPIAGYLEAAEYPNLPPASLLRPVEGADWVPLELRRNRSGEGRPPVGASRIGGRRRIVVGAEGFWRWASRGGTARQAYRSVFAGLAGWLLEAPDRNPVVLEVEGIAAGDSLRWRVAPDVERLVIVVRDSADRAVRADTILAPQSAVVAAGLPGGSYRFEAEGTAGGEPFRTGRPFEVAGADRELVAREAGDPIRGVDIGLAAPSRRGRMAVWPFVLAALMLCGEWFWRRRIGLR